MIEINLLVLFKIVYNYFLNIENILGYSSGKLKTVVKNSFFVTIKWFLFPKNGKIRCELFFKNTKTTVVMIDACQ